MLSSVRACKFFTIKEALYPYSFIRLAVSLSLSVFYSRYLLCTDSFNNFVTMKDVHVIYYLNILFLILIEVVCIILIRIFGLSLEKLLI